MDVHDLSAAYGDELLFAHATFTVGAADRIGLIGPNGAGKSTLLAILAGETRPATGHIEYPPRHPGRPLHPAGTRPQLLRRGQQFGAWVQAVEAAEIPELRAFAAGLPKGLGWSRLASPLSWSSGTVEGHVNRVKMLKRQMYDERTSICSAPASSFAGNLARSAAFTDGSPAAHRSAEREPDRRGEGHSAPWDRPAG